MTGKKLKKTDPVMNDSETINSEDFVMDDIEESQQDTIKKLKKKISSLQDEKKQREDELQRVRADFLNAKKRLEHEKLEGIVRSNEDIFERLFSVIDSFESAIGNSTQWDAIDKNWRAGMEAVLSQLLNVLKSYDVEQINPLNELFNPKIHEALSQTETDNKDLDGTVDTVIQKGYIRTVNDDIKILRPARVSVVIYKN